MRLRNLFIPFKSVPSMYLMAIFTFQALFIVSYFQFFNGSIVPKPTEIISALMEVIQTRDFVESLIRTLAFTGKATFFVILISTFLAYLSFVPSFSLLVESITKLRYLTLVGALFVLTFMFPSAEKLKMAVMFFGMVPFFINTLLGVFKPDPQLVFLCKTLRLSNWQALYETVILGKRDQIIETIRSNFAIAWLMIAVAEGVAMSLGGLGVMILKLNKHIGEMPKVIAIQLCILILGMGFDYFFRHIRVLLFPYVPKETKHV